MDDSTVQKVIGLTTRFYADVADSFSQTRISAWEGWQRIFDLAVAEGRQPFDVLDVACGNLRFERFLMEIKAPVRSVCAVDNCLQLAEMGLERHTGFEPEDRFVVGADQEADGILGRYPKSDPGLSLSYSGGFPFPVRFSQADIFERLDAGASLFSDAAHMACANDREAKASQGDAMRRACGALSRQGGEGDFSLVVCFGFMHHVPSPEQRLALLNALVRESCIGGIVAVSFWQFSNSERLLRKARAATELGADVHGISFDSENDYLLGWQSAQNAFRYCHNYTEDEINDLIASLCSGSNVRQVARFSSDGSTGDLNRYVVLKVEGR